MPGVLWSQQEKLASAAQALAEWQAKAAEVGVVVTQVNLTLPYDVEQPDLGGAAVVFEWDVEHQEWAMRTAGSPG
jgi:hypothetical protein